MQLPKIPALLASIGFAVLVSQLDTATAVSAEVIDADQTWEENRVITGDLIIPDGFTLTISKGVHVRFKNEEGSKSPPKVLVQGHLELEGEADAPVVFSPSEELKDAGWAGIVIDIGNAWLHQARIEGAHTAVYLSQGWVKVKKTDIEGNHCGIVVKGRSCGLKVEKSRITGNRIGLLVGDGSVVSFPDSEISGNSGQDIVSGAEGVKVPDSCKIAFIPSKPENNFTQAGQ